MATPLDFLPPPAPEGDFERVKDIVAAHAMKLVVLDDDPTGTQTVHGVDVLAEASPDLLDAALSDSRPCFYILTNSRSLPAAQAAALNRSIAAQLRQAAVRTDTRFCVVSRSDSTLRGHFDTEVGALQETLGSDVDATLVIPAFFEGGRYTIGGVHYVAEGERLVPAAETEFARDRTFGYRNSNLALWVEEKTAGRVRASDVINLPIEALRAANGAEQVEAGLVAVPRGSVVVVNAACYRDLEVFVLGLLRAEAHGRRFLFRTAASFVRVRAGLDPRPLLTTAELSGTGSAGGLVVVGSYVSKSTAQLGRLLEVPGTLGIEMVVDRLSDPESARREVMRVSDLAASVIKAGTHAVVYTSRGPTSSVGSVGDLGAGKVVSRALVEVVRVLPLRPRFLVAKGGITSSDLAIEALGMRRALVLGQASPGVPVWEMGPETRFPGLRYVVWPGNVGGERSLAELVARL